MKINSFPDLVKEIISFEFDADFTVRELATILLRKQFKSKKAELIYILDRMSLLGSKPYNSSNLRRSLNKYLNYENIVKKTNIYTITDLSDETFRTNFSNFFKDKKLDGRYSFNFEEVASFYDHYNGSKNWGRSKSYTHKELRELLFDGKNELLNEFLFDNNILKLGEKTPRKFPVSIAYKLLEHLPKEKQDILLKDFSPKDEFTILHMSLIMAILKNKPEATEILFTSLVLGEIKYNLKELKNDLPSIFQYCQMSLYALLQSVKFDKVKI